MRGRGWQGAFLRRAWRKNSTTQDPRAAPAPDLVNRQFTAEAPNRLWVADATRIPCGEGAFWLAAVRDAFSNRIVGWRCSDRCDTDLILGAHEYGHLVARHPPGPAHTSQRPRIELHLVPVATRLADNGILASVGSTGD